MYISHNVNGSWTPAIPIESLNKDLNNSAKGLSADGNNLVHYRDDRGDGNIYISEFDHGNWSPAKELGQNINTLSIKWNNAEPTKTGPI